MKENSNTTRLSPLQKETNLDLCSEKAKYSNILDRFSQFRVRIERLEGQDNEDTRRWTADENRL